MRTRGAARPTYANLSELSWPDSLARMTERKSVDWEAIEREYCAGQLSVREIAETCGVSHPAILKRAKRDGWERNLSDAVRDKVTTRLVTDGVTGKSARETVELAAE